VWREGGEEAAALVVGPEQELGPCTGSRGAAGGEVGGAGEVLAAEDGAEEGALDGAGPVALADVAEVPFVRFEVDEEGVVDAALHAECGAGERGVREGRTGVAEAVKGAADRWREEEPGGGGTCAVEGEVGRAQRGGDGGAGAMHPDADRCVGEDARRGGRASAGDEQGRVDGGVEGLALSDQSSRARGAASRSTRARRPLPASVRQSLAGRRRATTPPGRVSASARSVKRAARST
jgi:hypothetical protein